MKGAPVSEIFDDIYFSAEDGVAETNHVFLKGNHLPENWRDIGNFVITETGFGTGLNFLCTWKLFEKTAKLHQHLDFISIEKYPLHPDYIYEVLKPWHKYFGTRLDMLCKLYPILVAGFHRIQITPQITLTLIFDDIHDALPEMEAQVDCWFLDGFTPAKNPDMWNENLYTQMVRLSHDQTTYATFTAAGDVRRGLAKAGFSVEKRDGFGRKRDMIAGTYQQGRPKVEKPKQKKIAIIGAGLAGTSCAYVLNSYGYDITIYEASDHVGAGASGNSTGFYNPRFTAQRDEVSNFFAPAYAQIIRLAKQAGEDIDYNPCGALHLINAPEKEKRFHNLIQNWRWDDAHAQILDVDQASDIAGIALDHGALYLPDSGSVTPKKLCEYYARGIDVRLNTPIDDLDALDADIIILCNAHAVQKFKPLKWLELETVRGQVSVLQETELSKNLKCNIHYGGYLSPSLDGMHMVGATFQKWLDHTDIIQEDHQHNIENLKAALPVLERENFDVISGWAGLRTATKDRFPVIGPVPEQDNIYVSTAFGSHGIVGSLAGAHYIADLIRNGPLSLPASTCKALNPNRFIDRANKKGIDLLKTSK